MTNTLIRPSPQHACSLPSTIQSLRTTYHERVSFDRGAERVETLYFFVCCLRWKHRHLVFDDPSVLKRLECMVDAAAGATPPSPAVSTKAEPRNEADRTSFFDPDFESPRVQCSPEAATALLQAFSVLRNSCAGCRHNQDALRQTSLADTVRFGCQCVIVSNFRQSKMS